MFTAALFIIAKILKQPKCPSVDEWIKKWWYMKGWEKVGLQFFIWKIIQ